MIDKALYKSIEDKINIGEFTIVDIINITKDFENECSYLFMKNKNSELVNELLSARRLEKLYTEKLPDCFKYEIGSFHGKIEVFSLLTKCDVSERIFYENMEKINNKDDALKIIQYLYNNPNSTFIDIEQCLDIWDRKYIFSILLTLYRIGCIERILIKKNDQFSLSLRGIDYYKEYISKEN